MSDVIAHVIVRGKVQGVGYRAFVEDEAALRGLDGWVRNRHDGSLEAVFSGPPEEVEMVIEACRKGPWSAQVSGVDRRQGTRAELAERRPNEKFSLLPTV